MKLPQLFSLGFLLPLLLHAEAPQSLRPGDLVAICGDSITEQRRYSIYMADYLLMCQPQPDLRTVQLGIGGENSTMFLKRMGDDILPFKPAVVTTCYGMNDGGYAPSTPEMLALYRKSAEGIVAGLKKAGVRFILLGSPGAVDSFACAKVDPTIYNKTLGELADISREVAAENGVTFVDVHSLMLDAMAKAKAKYGSGYMVAGADGIHPGENGHVIMAYAFLKALGCSGDIGTITVDAKSGKAEATAGHAVVSAANGVVEIESTRYPFCFYGKPEDPAATSGMIEFLPFNQELNRYLLVVKNAPYILPALNRFHTQLFPLITRWLSDSSTKPSNLSCSDSLVITRWR